MIGKVVKPGKGFGGLVRYLLDGDRDATEPEARATWHATRNLLVDDPRLVPALMRATAAKSKRVKSPVYHYVISWHHNEAPTDDFMRQVADVTCDDLELGEYQRLYIAHDDTKHRHVHIVVNRVHPETGVAWKTSHDYARIEQSLKRQSDAMGIPFVPGRHNSKDRFRYRDRRPTTPEFRQAEKAEVAPLERWSLDRITDQRSDLRAIVDKAKSWSELRRAFQATGLLLSRKGQGLVFSDGAATIKLSQLGKDYRVATLERQFGQSLPQYEEHEQPLPTVTPRPEKAVQPSKPNVMAQQPRTVHIPSENVAPPTVHAAPQDLDLGIPADKLPSETAQLYQDLQSARDVASLAFVFFNAGLVTREQLSATLQDQARAQAEVDRTKPLIDQLLLPTPPAPEKPKPKHRLRRTLDRGR